MLSAMGFGLAAVATAVWTAPLRLILSGKSTGGTSSAAARPNEIAWLAAMASLSVSYSTVCGANTKPTSERSVSRLSAGGVAGPASGGSLVGPQQNSTGLPAFMNSLIAA